MMVMNIIIVSITTVNTYYLSWVQSHLLVSLLLSIFSTIVSYQILTEIIYWIVEHNDFLFKLYWGKLYLKGIWYYEYTLSSNASIKRYGVWRIEQDLKDIYITGYGYNSDLSLIRTRLSSVTGLIKKDNIYEIVHKKIEVQNPNSDFYAKSSISFEGLSNKYPDKFNSITYIYGGMHSGETHMDSFTKLKEIDTEDKAIQYLRRGGRDFIKNNELIGDKKIVLLVMGRTASGKTTIAERLSSRLSFKYIPCAYFKRLVKADYSASDSLDDNLRDQGLKLAVNEGISDLRKSGIVFDSSFGSKIRREYVINSFSDRADSFYYIYCISSDIKETQNRISARKGHEQEDIQYHASDFKVYEHINSTFEEPDINELSGYKNSNIITIDTFSKEIKILKDDIDDLARYIGSILQSLL